MPLPAAVTSKPVARAQSTSSSRRQVRLCRRRIAGQRLRVFLQRRQAEPSRTFEIVPEKTRTHRDFIGDVAVSPDGRLIYAAGLFHDAIHVINPQSGRVIEKFATGRRPYRILFHPDGKTLLRVELGRRRRLSPQAANGRAAGARCGSGSIRPTWSGAHAKADENDEEQKLWPARLFVAAAQHQQRVLVGVTREQGAARDRNDQRRDDARGSRSE